MGIKPYVCALLALGLASCADDNYLGIDTQNLASTEDDEIAFGTSTENMTRSGELTGSSAATKLGGQFVVYGWKSNGIDGSTYKDVQDVFQNYVVTYSEGSAGKTDSNTNGWEYVGNTSKPIGETGVAQTIKYWDHSFSQYDFIAWSIASGSSATLEPIVKNISETGYKPYALKFTAPTASDLAKIYISNQETVLETAYRTSANSSQHVTLTFRNMAAKVRLGIYETVPGYSIKDVKFYTALTTAGNATATLFTTATDAKPFATAGTVNAKFKSSDNDVVISTTATTKDSKVQFGSFAGDKAGENKETGSVYIGRASNDATLTAWYSEFPMDATEMVLKVDYTLVSTDGSAEEIKVTGAKATVPANYGEWKANYAYTYLFKISDNTNGSTSGVDPDVDPSKPAGLYPITFDANVVEVQEGNTQETITEEATPAITTYQKGSANTSESEYKPYSDANPYYIYVSNSTAAMYAKTSGSVNTKLYTAVDLGNDSEGISEKTVANYLNNEIILTDVTSSTNEAVEDVTTIEAGQAYDNVAKTLDKAGFRFKPQAGQTYVVEYTSGTTKTYKVIKVTGTKATPYYAIAVKTGANSTIPEGGTTTIVVTNGTNCPVVGAKNLFTGANDLTISYGPAAGEYDLVAKAVDAETIDNVSLKGCTSCDITIQNYAFDAATITVTEGSTGTSTLKLGTTAQTSVAVSEFTPSTGLSVTAVDASTGALTISAESGATSGTIKYGDFATLTVNVNKYSLALASGCSAEISTSGTTTLVVKLGTGDAAKDGTNITSSNPSAATVEMTADGEATVTAVAAGTTTITCGSATITITVTA